MSPRFGFNVDDGVVDAGSHDGIQVVAYFQQDALVIAFDFGDAVDGKCIG